MQVENIKSHIHTIDDDNIHGWKYLLCRKAQ